MAANDTIDYVAIVRENRRKLDVAALSLLSASNAPLERIAAALERIAAALERQAPAQQTVEKSEPPKKRDYIGMPG